MDAYILNAPPKIGDPRHAKLALHLPADEVASAAGQHFGAAVNNYFAYREWVAREDLRRLLRTGVVSLVIGLAFLFTCPFVRQVLVNDDATASRVLDEGLLIVRWVALWKLLEVALHDCGRCGASRDVTAL